MGAGSSFAESAKEAVEITRIQSGGEIWREVCQEILALFWPHSSSLWGSIGNELFPPRSLMKKQTTAVSRQV